MTKSIKSRKIGNKKPVIKEHVITQTMKLHASLYTQFPLIPNQQILIELELLPTRHMDPSKTLHYHVSKQV